MTNKLNISTASINPITGKSDTSGTASSSSTDRPLLARILMDFVIFVILIIPIILCEFIIEPFRRGFFCDDESIRYPFHDNTVTPVVLGVIIAVPPIAVLSLGEYARQHNRGRLNESRTILGLSMPLWISNCLQQFIYFVFGLLLTFDATEVGKYTIGRLRPHFMAVCQPQFNDGSTCSDSFNQHRYVENYFCLGTDFTVQDVRQGRLSFPSGHSSLAFYSMVYVSLYLQKRLTWKRSSLTRHFIQFSLIMIAWFTALSRVMDNWHHWSDVLAGSLIGIIGALLTAHFISKFFKSPWEEMLLEMNANAGSGRGLTRQETSATLNEELSSTPPPYVITESQPAYRQNTNGISDAEEPVYRQSSKTAEQRQRSATYRQSERDIEVDLQYQRPDYGSIV